MNEDLKTTIEDVKCELEESNECGELEERMELAQRLAILESLLSEKERKHEPAKWYGCGLCCGKGSWNDYQDTWPCAACNAQGGSWG